MAERVSYASVADAAWTVIAAPRTLVALSRPVDPGLVHRLWTLIRDGSTFESLVAEFPAESGGRPLSFVLLGDIDENSRGASLMALVNGPVGFDIASAGAPHHISPTGSAPWLRTRLQNVSNLAIGQQHNGAPFPLVSGVVTAGRVDMVFGTEMIQRPAADSASALARPSATTVVPAAVPTPAEPAVRSDVVFDHSVELHDGMTIRRTPSQAPPVTGPIRLPNLPEHPRTVMFGYRVNSGQAYALDLPHRFGRNPKTRSQNSVRLVQLLSPTKTVSATHMDIRQVGDVVIVSDLNSTNGTSVIVPGGRWGRLAPGESLVVPAGSFVDVGDGNVIEIMPGVPLS
ncbi:FHA domain-containing protein [Paramicrobacterium humi]|uniref:FHA domain-containing protein n=1 Tax=Paramicrobacterium humi TaxID=640635 RepID=A0A1H4IWE4_9MICO|nr:FHA domain-containing protein [Microbacterium humi]SEB37552.1 FHA domain-containing protein [Microbacterium humi]